uniref:EB domain-containing protein n=1 Tax=Anopheles quadriannulatus TaxID=34691 RepID=A0A182XAS4_ANOQN
MFRGSCRLWCFATALALLPLAFPAESVPKSVSIPPICLNGAKVAGKCVCNPGYSEYKGNCYLTQVPAGCPAGSVLWNGSCHPQVLPPILEVVPAKESFIVVPPLHIKLPVPDPLDPNNVEEEQAEDEDDDDAEQVGMVPTRDHHLTVSYEKIVNNHNVINNETTFNTNTVNNVIVQIMRRKANGALRMVVIRNNETTVHEEGPNETKPPSKTETPPAADSTDEPATTKAPDSDPPCCMIVSPRVCRKQEDEWVCFHRKQYVCARVCTAKVMYLQPRKPRYQHPWLIMPPMTNYPAYNAHCRMGQCPRPDCSGCLRGRSRCHPMCYTYDCAKNASCHFVDQDAFCKDSPGQVCVMTEEKIIDLLEQPKANRTLVG